MASSNELKRLGFVLLGHWRLDSVGVPEPVITSADWPGMIALAKNDQLVWLSETRSPIGRRLHEIGQGFGARATQKRVIDMLVRNLSQGLLIQIYGREARTTDSMTMKADLISSAQPEWNVAHK
jgi:hypothetical protein